MFMFSLRFVVKVVEIMVRNSVLILHAINAVGAGRMQLFELSREPTKLIILEPNIIYYKLLVLCSLENFEKQNDNLRIICDLCD